MKEHPPSQPAPPLSRPLTLAEVPPEGLELRIVASEAERAALAAANALPGVAALEAQLRARRWRGDGLALEGELRARITQTCVVTLDDFETDIVEPIELRFAPPAESPRLRAHRGEPEPAEHDALGEDPPDPLIGDAVDVGAVVSEFFTLALDPYPRKPGAEFVEPSPAAASEATSPFAQLKVIAGGKPPPGD